jgi:hypothetical protein
MQTLLLFWLVANLCVLAVWAGVWAREMLQSGVKTSAMASIDRERKTIEDLLPWHAAGTLSGCDVDRVEDALACDPTLARSDDLVREELNETILLNETLGAPSARTIEKLFAAIDAEPTRSPKISYVLVGRLAAFVSSLSPGTLAWVATAAVLTIVMQAGLIVTSLVKAAQRTELAFTGLNDSSIAIVRFVPKANVADITRFLEVNRVSVIEGPKRGGTYTIRLPVTDPDRNDLIKQLQAPSAIVEFIATVQ